MALFYIPSEELVRHRPRVNIFTDINPTKSWTAHTSLKLKTGLYDAYCRSKVPNHMDRKEANVIAIHKKSSDAANCMPGLLLSTVGKVLEKAVPKYMFMSMSF